MKVEFISGFAAVAADVPAAVAFYRDALGLPLEGDGYPSSDAVDGARHFGIWSLEHAANACFGADRWPEDRIVPHATIEFEVASAGAVAAAAAELASAGHRLIHDARREPWGQTVARLQTADGLLVGISFTPWMHGAAPQQ